MGRGRGADSSVQKSTIGVHQSSIVNRSLRADRANVPWFHPGRFVLVPSACALGEGAPPGKAGLPMRMWGRWDALRSVHPHFIRDGRTRFAPPWGNAARDVAELCMAGWEEAFQRLSLRVGDRSVAAPDWPLHHALVALNKECRKAGRISAAVSFFPAFLPSLFISTVSTATH